MLALRPVRDEDLSIICSFPQSAEELFFMFPKANYPLTVEQLAAVVAERRDNSVLLAGTEVIGFANYYVCEPGIRCAIGNVIVAPVARGKGAGRYLVDTMTALAFDKYHVKQVEIACFNKNVSGLLLYACLGFEPFSIEERAGFHGERTALIHIRKLAQGEMPR